MSRTLGMLLSSLVLAAGAQTGPETVAQTEAQTGSSEASRWHHNPRGRTEAGIEHQNGSELEAASDAFGAALGLAPGDPVVRFNAGTASLLNAGDQAVELLQSATEIAPPGLMPLAYYNLGNAHFAGQKLPQAIESYKQSLRLDPHNLDAKHNLELAQRLLQEQQQQQQQDRDQDQQNQDQQQEQQEQEQGDGQQEQQPNPEEQQQEQQENPDSRLPDFEDQPDMTAEQAAAILEAVENLEREQRRKQAMEQLKRAKGDRDW